MRSRLRRFHKKNFSSMHLHIPTVVFTIKSLFSMVVNIFCFHAFSTVKGLFFWGLLLYEIILEPEKNVLEKSLKTLGLYFQRLFIWATISENFFFKEFFWRLSMMVHISSLGLSGPDRFSRFDVYRLQRNRQKSVVYI